MAVGGIIYNFLKFFEIFQSLSFSSQACMDSTCFLLKGSYLYIVKHDNMVQKATLLHKNISHRNLNNSTSVFAFTYYYFK